MAKMIGGLFDITKSGSFSRHFRGNHLIFDHFCPPSVKDMAHGKHLTPILPISPLYPVNMVHFAKEFLLVCHDFSFRVPSRSMSIWIAPFGETLPPVFSIFLEEIFLGTSDPPRVVANFLRSTGATA